MIQHQVCRLITFYYKFEDVVGDQKNLQEITDLRSSNIVVGKVVFVGLNFFGDRECSRVKINTFGT